MNGGRRTARRALVVLLATALAACRATPAPRFAPVLRVLDDPAIARPPGLAWGAVVTLGDESRPVISATQPALVHLELEEAVPIEGARTYTVDIPPAVAAAPWVALEPQVRIGPRMIRQAARLLQPAAEGTSAAVTLHFPAPAAGTTTAFRIDARPIPMLPSRDVLTGPLPVTAKSRLRLAIGIEEPAWEGGAVDFAVAALDGADELPLFAQRLDPAAAPTDRGWRDAEVDLDHLAGRTVRLRFTARPADPSAAPPSLPVWGDPVVLAPRPGDTRRNLLLISLDTLRAVSVSAYGAKRATTPGLDDLMGARGALCEHAIAPFPHTLPSHMSLFTGLYQRTHGVRGFLQSLPRERPVLPELLRAAGYDTAAFTEDGFLLAGAGFERGFAVYAENKSADLHQPTGQIADTFARGRAWMAKRAGEPFFLFLHTYQVHLPYVPPPGYTAYFGDASKIADRGERERLLYEQEIRYTDDEVRALLRHLSALGLEENTLVIVTSDHGEEFFEHGQRLHGYQLFDEVLRVPLFMRLPGAIPAGLRVAAPVSLIDVMPTVLELLGLPPVSGTEGVSLVPLLREAPAPPARTAVFAEAPSSLVSGYVDLAAARTATHKCIFHGLQGTTECFDLIVDPEERRPLTADGVDPRLVAARAQLDAFRAGTAVVAGDHTGAPLDPATEQKLRALGYLQ